MKKYYWAILLKKNVLGATQNLSWEQVPVLFAKKKNTENYIRDYALKGAKAVKVNIEVME